MVTQSPIEFEAAIVNAVRAYPREEVSRENADLTTRMRRQRGEHQTTTLAVRACVLAECPAFRRRTVRCNVHERARIEAPCSDRSKRNPPPSHQADPRLTDSEINVSAAKRLIIMATQSSHHRKASRQSAGQVAPLKETYHPHRLVSAALRGSLRTKSDE
jgi:hypothetical protein